MDMINLDAWTGRMVEETGAVSHGLAQQIHATMGAGAAPRHGDLLPPLWHWCAFPPAVPADELGPDGHPASQPLLPPVPLKRRMWAGGSLRFLAPLRVGDPLTRRSTLRGAMQKQTATGDMLLMTVDHSISGPQGLAIEERQDIVYLNIPERFDPPKARPMPERIVERVETSETLLFRYSAITFNAHRIHYDRDYATQVEHYPGLVVHGPLQASLLMRAAVRHKGRLPSSFTFRGVHPMFVGAPLDLAITEEDGALSLFAGQSGHQGTQATAIWEETV